MLNQVLVTSIASTVDPDADETQAQGLVLVTLALNAEDAQAVVNAAEFGHIWMSAQNDATVVATDAPDTARGHRNEPRRPDRRRRGARTAGTPSARRRGRDAGARQLRRARVAADLAGPAPRTGDPRRRHAAGARAVDRALGARPRRHDRAGRRRPRPVRAVARVGRDRVPGHRGRPRRTRRPVRPFARARDARQRRPAAAACRLAAGAGRHHRGHLAEGRRRQDHGRHQSGGRARPRDAACAS